MTAYTALTHPDVLEKVLTEQVGRTVADDILAALCTEPDPDRGPIRTVPAPGQCDLHILRVRDAELRIFDRAPDTTDGSDMYVLDVFGVSLRIRLRHIEPHIADRTRTATVLKRPHVHVDPEHSPHGVLQVEIGNRGVATYPV